MKNLWLIFLVAILLVNCRPQVGEENSTPAPTTASLNGQPIPVALSDLAANPSIYEGAYIQLTGQYSRLPLLVCQSNAQPSPATWGLASDTLLALVGGFDEQLRPLLPENLMMTVAGRWQHWAGPVGCGDTALPQDIWYLASSRIVSPSPITRATLTPEGSLVAQGDSPPEISETIIFATPSATSNPIGSPTPTLLPGQPTEQPDTPNATPTITSLIITPTPTAKATNALTPTSTINVTLQPSATTTSSGGAVPTNTPTPSATPRPGTTPTSAPLPTSGPSPTSTPQLDNIDMGNLNPDLLEMDFLASDEKHTWLFYNEISANSLTLHALAEKDVDIALVVIDPNGAALVLQDEAPAGQVETITDLALTREGDYKIIIYAVNEAVGDYGLMAQDSASFPKILFNIIGYNRPTTTSFDENTEQIWFFTGVARDTITISADPDDNSDVDFEFFGPGNEFIDFIADGLVGETEALVDYPLDASGLFGFWLFGEASGTITADLTITTTN